MKYRTSIPRHARERVVETYSNGAKKRSDYLHRGRVVGIRCFFESGELLFETSLKDGKKHGAEYDWLIPGKLTSVERFVNGLSHGVARQWSIRGKPIGTFRMNHGTGIDLWRCEREDGSVYLSEVLYLRKGLPAGFRWGINEDQSTVCLECHFNNTGRLHGISREWNAAGRLRRGFPQYYVNNKRVTKRQYAAACRIDSTLPPMRASDDNPRREFPREIAKWLRPGKHRP